MPDIFQTNVERAREIAARLENGDETVTQSEIDFCNRVLNKNYGGVSGTGSFWNDWLNATVEYAGNFYADLKAGATNTLDTSKTLVTSLAVIAVVVLVFWFLWKQGKLKL
jgi:hypothetical protein